jgi:hypothetical protein
MTSAGLRAPKKQEGQSPLSLSERHTVSPARGGHHAASLDAIICKQSAKLTQFERSRSNQ